MEISHINLLKGLECSLKTCLRIALLGIPAILFGFVSKNSRLRIALLGVLAILFGIVFEDNLIANVDWMISSITLLLWGGLIVSLRIFSARIPLNLVEEV